MHRNVRIGKKKKAEGHEKKMLIELAIIELCYILHKDYAYCKERM